MRRKDEEYSSAVGAVRKEELEDFEILVAGSYHPRIWYWCVAVSPSPLPQRRDRHPFRVLSRHIATTGWRQLCQQVGGRENGQGRLGIVCRITRDYSVQMPTCSAGMLDSVFKVRKW